MKKISVALVAVSMMIGSVAFAQGTAKKPETKRTEVKEEKMEAKHMMKHHRHHRRHHKGTTTSTTPAK